MSQLKPFQTVGPASIPLKQADNNNLTTARMGVPFKPDTMTQGNDFSIGRAVYLHTNPNPNTNLNVTTHTTTTTYTNRPIKVTVNNSTLKVQNSAGKKKNYNVSAAERTYLLKANAIGKSSTNRLNPNPRNTMSFSGVDQTTVKNALVRVRNAGTVAPKKKGASPISTSSLTYAF